MSKIKMYMELSEQKRIIDAQLEALKPEVLEEMGDDPVQNGNYSLSKVTKRLAKLKEGVSITDIMEKLPEAIQYKPDMKWLQKNAAGHEYIEFEKSQYLTIRAIGKNESESQA